MRVAPLLLVAVLALAASRTEAAPPDAGCAVAPAPAETPDAFVDFERVAASKNPCAVADNNLARDEAEILKPRPPAAAPKFQAWDHIAKPDFLDAIRARLELQPAELALIGRIGFAVPARLEVPSFAHGYHEIFQSQLPVYVTADSIFHAVFASHDAIVQRLEQDRLAPMLTRALDALHCELVAASADYPPEVARDLDLYLLVARRLLSEGEAPRSAFGDRTVERQAADLVAKAIAASELTAVSLFGRTRLVDFTQYGPRGHYADDERMQRYFRAAMWASRLEFNLVSRSSRSSAPGPEPDPTETPREAIDALALADLATRSGAASVLADFDAAWGVLAGRREDVSVAQLAELRRQVGKLTDAHAFDRLKAAIGDRFRRTTRLHPMPEGTGELPAIATLLGPRIVADAGALTSLVDGAVPNRQRLGAPDVAYALGLDAAKRYLAEDLAAYPKLETQLAVARANVAAAPSGEDLYGAWLAAIRGLAANPSGVQPSFFASEAGDDLRLNAVAGAYGQLKHNFALVAGQPYAEFGCEIPDGFVEPRPAAYDGLIEYSRRGARLAALLDPKDIGGVRAHFERMGQVLRVLRHIVDDELANRPLSATERRWLGMVAELNLNRSIPMTGDPPTYTGWYFDLFFQRQDDGMRGADYIADYFTSSAGVAYIGATAPRLGIFVVDVGGAPRAFVGPVARSYAIQGALGARYSDDTARTLAERDEPWAASYTIPAAPAPSLQLRWEAKTHRLALTSNRALGAATIKALDHHRVAVGTVHANLGRGETRVAIAAKGVDGFFLEIGEFRDFVVADSHGEISGHWGAPPL